MRSVLKGEEVSSGRCKQGLEVGQMQFHGRRHSWSGDGEAEEFRPVPCRAGERSRGLQCASARKGGQEGARLAPNGHGRKRLDGKAGPGSLRCQAVALKRTVGDFL